jgi:energy-coupling factor transporter ATP-binding protein EcfA2
MRQRQGISLQSHAGILRTLGDQLAKLARRSTALEKSERILESLYCEEAHRRELGVSEAESCTFSWAFDSWCLGHRLSCGCSCLQSEDDLRSNGRCWRHYKAREPSCADHENYQKHLLNWLKRDTNEPFMVTGKPGSGKSTFMKFLAGHEQTRSALDTWSAGRELVVASFYFWSSGTPLQRSQDGLLRCLLYKVLSHSPNMIPVAVPRRWQVADQPPIAQPWSSKEIFNVFANVVHANSLSTKFCFFIDGLDEYGGPDLGSGETDFDLVLRLKTLSSSPCIKLCLSSRPRNVFKGHLPTSGPHHITLHDHTTKDIVRLVESRIHRVQGLIVIESAGLEELKHMIVVRSSGVFLWVVLVVRELLAGLEPPFSMPEMRERLLMLPATLDGFFRKILDNVHPQYRRFNARLLLLSVCHHELMLCYAYNLWLLEYEESDLHPHAANNIERQRLHSGTNMWRTDTTSRINKVCGDFLVVNEGIRDEFFIRDYIGHNHRSVVDFLRLPAVREELLVLAGWHFESDIYLMHCELFVSCCEAYLIPLGGEHQFSKFAELVTRYERSSGTACVDLIYRLDRTLCSLPLLPAARSHKLWVDNLLMNCHDKWRICEAHALLFCASFHGFTLFMEQAIKTLPTEAWIFVLNDILKALVLGCYHCCEDAFMPESVEFLCSKGANVNSVARVAIIPMIQDSSDINTKSPELQDFATDETNLGPDPGNLADELADCTIWELYLLESDFGGYPHHHESINLAIVLIEAGADLECRLPEDCDDIEEAIVKRVGAELNMHKTNRNALDDRGLRQIRAALARRGVTSKDHGNDESVEDARNDLSDEDVDRGRVALEVTGRYSDTDEPPEDAFM